MTESIGQVQLVMFVGVIIFPSYSNRFSVISIWSNYLASEFRNLFEYLDILFYLFGHFEGFKFDLKEN